MTLKQMRRADEAGIEAQYARLTRDDRLNTVARLRQLGWTVFCDEEEDDVQ